MSKFLIIIFLLVCACAMSSRRVVHIQDCVTWRWCWATTTRQTKIRVMEDVEEGACACRGEGSQGLFELCSDNYCVEELSVWEVH